MIRILLGLIAGLPLLGWVSSSRSAGASSGEKAEAPPADGAGEVVEYHTITLTTVQAMQELRLRERGA